MSLFGEEETEQKIEIIDGKEYIVKILPPVDPPKGRSKKTRYHYDDVDKPGTKRK